MNFASHKETPVCSLTEELHYLILGGPVSIQTKSVTGRTVSRQGTHTCHSRTDGHQKRREWRSLWETSIAWMSFPTVRVHSGAGWDNTPNQDVSQSTCTVKAQPLSQAGTGTLLEQCPQGCDSNYEAAVSPAFLGMLLTTPLICILIFEVRTSYLQEAFPPAIPKAQETTVKEVQNVPSSKNTWILPVQLKTGQVEIN